MRRTTAIRLFRGPTEVTGGITCFSLASLALVSASLPSLRSPPSSEVVRSYGLCIDTLCYTSPVLPDPGFYSIFHVVPIRSSPIRSLVRWLSCFHVFIASCTDGREPVLISNQTTHLSFLPSYPFLQSVHLPIGIHWAVRLGSNTTRTPPAPPLVLIIWCAYYGRQRDTTSIRRQY